MTRYNELGEIRRSQVVSTYGPGAIVDFRAGRSGDAAISVVAAGLETWEEVPPEIAEATKVYEPRLSHLLHVNHFRLAPVAPQEEPWKKDGRGPRVFLQGRRFPLWLQCPRCHQIGPFSRWTSNPGDPSLTCAVCSASGDTAFCVPVRFVVTCTNGHLDEFPWGRWVHGDSGCGSEDLELTSSGGTGLASLILHCKTCKSSRSMDGALSRGAFKGWTCKGKRPWLDDKESCEEDLVAVQRGASNLYFARTYSALDIPPWSHPIMRTLGANWAALAKAPAEKRRVALEVLDEAHRYTQRLGRSQDEILEAIQVRVDKLAECSAETLRREEHLRLLDPAGEIGPGHEFETAARPVPRSLVPFVSALVEVRKLREVRALTGFTRVSPPGPADDGEEGRVARLSRNDLGWLPAVEVRGEGIYVELEKKQIADWQHRNRATLDRLLETMQRRHHRAWDDAGKDTPAPERPINARHLLVHTLAHALIRQLSLDCGYSSASLRERLYVESGDYEMAGFLIYTGSSDADGTLGGLSRQAEPGRFEEFFVDAIRSLAWCSNDPLCIHGEASSEPLNRAACHSCSLVAETSCESFNQLLDRSLLVGVPENRDLGFFARLLRDA